jgi:hypothetical protein
VAFFTASRAVDRQKQAGGSIEELSFGYLQPASCGMRLQAHPALCLKAIFRDGFFSGTDQAVFLSLFLTIAFMRVS